LHPFGYAQDKRAYHGLREGKSPSELRAKYFEIAARSLSRRRPGLGMIIRNIEYRTRNVKERSEILRYAQDKFIKAEC